MKLKEREVEAKCNKAGAANMYTGGKIAWLLNVPADFSSSLSDTRSQLNQAILVYVPIYNHNRCEIARNSYFVFRSLRFCLYKLALTFLICIAYLAILTTAFTMLLLSETLRSIAFCMSSKSKMSETIPFKLTLPVATASIAIG